MTECDYQKYCFNLRYLNWKNNIGKSYNISNPKQDSCLPGKLNCPSAQFNRQGIDGWPATNASPTLDGVSTGVGVNHYPTYSNGYKSTPIWGVTLGGVYYIKPYNYVFGAINYKLCKFHINIAANRMQESYNIPIQYIKGSKYLYNRNIRRDNNRFTSMT